jgi:murein DD-endopeptidase MepM/ murein hydrolase activator NlpD
MEKKSYQDEMAIKRRLASIERRLPKAKLLNLNKPLKIKKSQIKKYIFKKFILVIISLCFGFVTCPPFLWPVQGNISSNFLFRFKPGSVILGIEIHHGIDIAAPKGKPVYPTAIGIIDEIGKTSELGNYIKIEHILGFESLYAHLDEITIRKGSIVVPGLSKIGKVGATGRATGPHLHFGIFYNGVALPPKTMMVFHTIRLKIIGI